MHLVQPNELGELLARLSGLHRRFELLKLGLKLLLSAHLSIRLSILMARALVMYASFFRSLCSLLWAFLSSSRRASVREKIGRDKQKSEV